MNRVTVAIVDYGLGNHASIRHALQDAGMRVRIGADAETLDACDVLLLPGVGAFPAAMQRLQSTGLDKYLRHAAFSGRALLGICLGMQLLVEESLEFGHSVGLGILPGKAVALHAPAWHIGWNNLHGTGNDPAVQSFHGEQVYFNHSYALQCEAAYVTAVAMLGQPIVAAIRREKIVGLQFHPEKSQSVGHQMLSSLITELAHA